MHKHWIFLALGIFIGVISTHLLSSTKAPSMQAISTAQQTHGANKAKIITSTNHQAITNTSAEKLTNQNELSDIVEQDGNFQDFDPNTNLLSSQELAIQTSISEADINAERERTEWENPSEQHASTAYELSEAELEEQRLDLEQQIAMELENERNHKEYSETKLAIPE